MANRKKMCGQYFDDNSAGREIVVVFGKGYAFGTIDDIRTTFADRIGDKIDRVPINDINLRHEDGVISSLIGRALVGRRFGALGQNSRQRLGNRLCKLHRLLQFECLDTTQ